MKWSIAILFFLVLAIGLGVLLKIDTGFVYIEYGNWTMEMPLAITLLMIIVLWLLIDWMIKIIVDVWGLPSVFRKWRTERQLHRAVTHTEAGFVDLLMGENSAAQKHLLRGIQPKLKFSVFNYLALSYIAMIKKQEDKQNQYIALALKQCQSVGGDKLMAFMIELTNAQFHLRQNHVEDASALFDRLEKIKPNNKFVLLGLKEVALVFGDYEKLFAIIKRLKRIRAIDEQEITDIQLLVARIQINDILKEDQKTMVTWYEKLQTSIRYDLDILLPLTRRAIAQGWDDIVEPWLRDAIDRDFQDQSVQAYGYVAIKNGAKQLKIATAWLDKHPCNVALLVTLGRLCWREKLWGQARLYLSDAIKQEKRPDAYYLLGLVEQALSMEGAALSYYQQGLSIEYDHL